ncbi:thiamine-phosphate diphosphorylase [Scopulibacillus darangshiensis]|uniref:Thiamine-phosphate synthase n=1 Tax=Scopulibacillus darangshiensis TaxID=442528 RepID=A0A4R2NRG6_9BACL|nr:thiamine phosphate synthase [Scopulibacillus darangshiensis]TCP24513.1 thiamine-phosphate diphosphorylase [Scopulibacillus darangshiensis]
MSNNIDYSLYLVTEAYREGYRSEYLKKVRQALQGGVNVLQFREKNASSLRQFELAKALKDMSQSFHVPFIINDRVDIALAVNADGVHVGQEDLPAEDVRRLIGPDKLLGVSAATVEEAVKAERDGADYLGVGSVFQTGSKGDATLIEMDEIARIRQEVTIPIVAIGGINAENVKRLPERHADGIAVISAILSAADPKGAAEQLKEQFLSKKHK